MTQQTIHASEKPVSKILGPDFLYRIPSYQRPYSWEPEHVLALLDDLDDAVVQDPDYFLGSVVIVENPDGWFDVIDGQQRLTTLTIMFSVLAAVVPPDMANKLYEPFILQSGHAFLGQETTYRLRVREQEVDFFEKHIQTPGGLESLLAKDATGLNSEVERRIHANATALHQALAHRSQDALTGLAQYVALHAFLVVVRASQFEAAYRIFTVMNDRGLDLAASDILKARVVGNLPDELRLKYATTWESMEQSLGRSGFSELFSHLRMVETHRKATKTILKEMETLVLPKYTPAAFIDDLVIPYGEDLFAIKHASWKSGTEAKSINRLLRWLGEIDNFDWVPPTLKWMHEHGDEPGLVLAFVQAMDRLASSTYIRRLYVQPRVKRFGAVLDVMEDGGDVFADDSPLLLTDEEKIVTRQVLEGNLYDLSGGVARYVLMRLDATLADAAATWDHEVISIEHVLPQGPKDGSVWTTWFTDDERIEWTNKLANLVPLSRRRNSGASNYEFDIKKKQYFAVDGQASPFVLTNQVLHEPVWTPAVLEERQASLMGSLSKLWHLTKTSVTPPMTL